MTYQPFRITGEDRPGPWLVTCDHATNTIPAAIRDGSLGLGQADMGRHIAYDPGAAGVSFCLGEALGAPVVTSNFSRLVIDPNRGEDDPTLLMRIYDGTVIPGNRFADSDELAHRLTLCYRPYHDAVARVAARHPDPAICAVHSFTPRLRGRAPRPWHVGVLHSYRDSRLAHALIARLTAEGDIVVGDNEPYGGHLPGDSIDRHALSAGRANVLIELRQDLIETLADQRAWARRLAPLLQAALADIGQSPNMQHERSGR
ncbi:MAG: N-formylglutamate amidohydrolase [Pseudomonadota bacterium]